jgi:hypothetical protein
MYAIQTNAVASTSVLLTDSSHASSLQQSVVVVSALTPRATPVDLMTDVSFVAPGPGAQTSAAGFWRCRHHLGRGPLYRHAGEQGCFSFNIFRIGWAPDGS